MFSPRMSNQETVKVEFEVMVLRRMVAVLVVTLVIAGPATALAGGELAFEATLTTAQEVAAPGPGFITKADIAAYEGSDHGGP